MFSTHYDALCVQHLLVDIISTLCISFLDSFHGWISVKSPCHENSLSPFFLYLVHRILPFSLSRRSAPQAPARPRDLHPPLGPAKRDGPASEHLDRPTPAPEVLGTCDVDIMLPQSEKSHILGLVWLKPLFHFYHFCLYEHLILLRI